MVWVALRGYADDHEGKFPPKLSDLSPYVPGPDTLRFRDPETKQLTDWQYYPGHSMADPPDVILVASPVPMVERGFLGIGTRYRVFSTINASSEFTAETEFQRRFPASGQSR